MAPRIGLFGKLPSRGDFVARAVPAEILQHWEGWLERSVAGAKAELGEAWQETWDAAPVWRFWIGEMVFGHPVAGVLAPSRDKVGRRFPLTLFVSGAGPRHPAPPLADDGTTPAWYDTLERTALQAGSPGFDGDLDAMIQRIPLPDCAVQAQPEDRRFAFFAYGESGLPQLMEDVRAHDHQLASAVRTYWWTPGNDRVGPAMIAQTGMPDGAALGAMLTGFGPPAEAPPPPPATPPPPVPPADWNGGSADAWAAPPPMEPEHVPEPEAMPRPGSQASPDHTPAEAESPFAAGTWDVPASPRADLAPRDDTPRGAAESDGDLDPPPVGGAPLPEEKGPPEADDDAGPRFDERPEPREPRSERAVPPADPEPAEDPDGAAPTEAPTADDESPFSGEGERARPGFRGIFGLGVKGHRRDET
ncbi:type VI secretion system-associated protein TagF [Roseicyclus sp. F158]|uniref:Type VI secretion system-associated protein TagF n=1 Tax=Tropicimonas omnivorans TaxID=3075590 RepID=A0ABU3DE01_9RHOB|nr:type VI secretion system-associated protein TagF [Roseicyclus sp. F158]MDT0681951.1 type VI secretion system-associated protein TagF [Roseicyclus sp. F158]